MFSIGVEDNFYFEPLLAHFIKLMKAYQALEAEKKENE